MQGGVVGSLLERLEQREAAARVRVQELRVELAALAERLADQEALLERLEVTKQTVIEVLAEDGAGVEADTAAVAVASVPGTGMQVPAFTPDADGAGRLPVAYRDVVEVLADAGVALRASQVCRALGLGGEPRHREGMRSKLKRLVGRGWLVEGSPGLFAPADGVAGALNGNGADSGAGGDRPS
jgi:hypothetical protein